MSDPRWPNAWERPAAAERKANERNPDEPEPGFKRMSWTWPKEWGEPVERWPWRSPWGLSCETLVFANRERVKRLTVPVHGYD